MSGCATTQQEATRLQLDASRIRVAETHTLVRSAGHRVRVLDVTLVRGDGAAAFVVTVANDGSRAVSDLPISVGVSGGHGGHGGRSDRRYLNGGTDLSYYDAHLPAVAPGGRLSWVWVDRGRLPARARPFALVGDAADPVAGSAGAPPSIGTRRLIQSGGATGAARVAVALHNGSGVPQYQLPVYAVARRGGRIVAAGAASVAHLGTHRTEPAIVPVIGLLAGARLELAAVPTMLR